jgi:hypothetical protein
MVYYRGEGEKMIKKALWWGVALCALFIFAGCPADDPGNNESTEGPKTPAGWTNGITDLSVSPGGNPGEIRYSFSEAKLASGTGAITYTLYYIEGAKTKTADVLAGTSGVINAAVNGKIEGTVQATADKTYSVVVTAGSGALDDAKSGVKTIKTLKSFTLTVNGIPPSEKIIGGSLLNEQNGVYEPVAAGLLVQGKDFIFYSFSFSMTMPDFTSPFATPGEYYIALASSVDGTGAYMYGTPDPVKVSFPTNTPLNWAQFKKVLE